MQNSNSILNLVLIGFHHRKGSVVSSLLHKQVRFHKVELVYPSLSCDGSDPTHLPHPWRHLPALAIADGAHNYTKDCTYFSLPSIEKKDAAVFGIACYRQADSASYVQPNPEITRNTVQKSLVVLSRFPLFSFIAHHLTTIIDNLFKSKGFTPESLQNSYEQLSHFVDTVLSDPVSYQDALFYNLSASNFVRVYKRDALCLFKLLLLERRILFTGDSGGTLSNWMLTLLSLYPDMLRSGLSQCSVIDPSWISETSYWSNMNDSSSNSFNSCQYSLEGSLTKISGQVSEQNTDSTLNKEEDVQLTSNVDSKNSANNIDPQRTHIITIPDTLHTESKQPVINESYKKYQTNNFLEKITDDSMFKFSLNSPFPTDDWGFPLSVFTKSYLAPMYIPLGLMDKLLEHSSLPMSFRSSINSPSSGNQILTLTDRSVRGFVAGATNPLLQSNKQLTEVFVLSLSPVKDICENYFPHLSELTGAFGKSTFGIETDSMSSLSLSENSTKTSYSINVDSEKNTQNTGSKVSNFSRPFSLPKRSQPIIQINSENITDKYPVNSRSMPVPLNRALQLSRTDRLFIDHLVMTVNTWYSAQIDYCQQLSSKKGELVTSHSFHRLDQLDTETLEQLTLIQKTALLRFPSQTILDAWIRQQFLIYLRALLLSAQGYSKLFLCSFFSLLYNIVNINTSLYMGTVIIKSPNISINFYFGFFVLFHNSQLQDSCTTSPDSVAAVVSQHPGRKLAEPDDWNQIAGSFKKFVCPLSIVYFLQLLGDFNSTFRSSSPSSFVWKFSDALKSVVSNPISISSPILPLETTGTKDESISPQINVPKTQIPDNKNYF
ncbi:uncharacterized protein DC041_0013134 [Schistosoma bovis]|uniref:UDENN domain-containing protein n=1 Tax=Schistosoma bovis TaxID=6184 RepID=A0A430Q855_SCHBO|nr:uncharacterized protein DC041_0013134 [Schistosoma bovis]